MLGSIVRTLFAGILALLLVQASASAATITTGSLTDTISISDANNPVLFGNQTTGPVDDVYLLTFEADGSEALSSILFTTPILSGPSNPEGLNLALYDVENFDGTTYTYDVALSPLGSGAGTMSALGLVPGTSYILTVMANATGQDIRRYDGRITATPLPPALLIFGTGLFGLGFLSRYRRRRQGQLGLQA